MALTTGDWWEDVENAYRDLVLRDGLGDLPEDELWELAKKRAKRRYLIDEASERSETDGRKYSAVLRELLNAERILKVN